jgi:hypothetical protein
MGRCYSNLKRGVKAFLFVQLYRDVASDPEKRSVVIPAKKSKE